MEKQEEDNMTTLEEIRREMKKTNPSHINKRLLVLKLHYEDGMKSKDAGKIAGLHTTSVNRILKRYQTQGIQAIVGVRHNHGNRYMTREQESEFLKQFSTMAEAGQVIEVTEIYRAYEQAVGHPVTRAAIYYLLKRHGWRKVMPRSKHPKKASDEAIDAYKKNQPNHPYDAYGAEKTTSDVSGRG